MLVLVILGVWVADIIGGGSRLTFRSFLSALVGGMAVAVTLAPLMWARWLLPWGGSLRRNLVAIGLTALWAVLCLVMWVLVSPALRDLLGPDF